MRDLDTVRGRVPRDPAWSVAHLTVAHLTSAPGWAPQEREGGHGALDPDERPSSGGLPRAPGAASDGRRM